MFSRFYLEMLKFSFFDFILNLHYLGHVNHKIFIFSQDNTSLYVLFKNNIFQNDIWLSSSKTSLHDLPAPTPLAPRAAWSTTPDPRTLHQIRGCSCPYTRKQSSASWLPFSEGAKIARHYALLIRFKVVWPRGASSTILRQRYLSHAKDGIQSCLVQGG